jgi:peroxiredoxin
MVATNSCMLPIGTKAPSFSLPDVLSNKETHLADNQHANGYLIAFICNHCPFVIHLLEHLPDHFNKIQKAGIRVFAISSNDIEKYPQDSPDKMRQLGLDYNFEFPYLYDESQQVAKSFTAACTPDFFLFDENLELFYRGRYDISRPGSTDGVSGKDLLGAVDALLKKEKVPAVQLPSIGCNIKWRSENEPDYFKK